MAYHVLPKRLAQLGFCCPQEYFEATSQLSTSEIQEELQLHLRSVRRWRSKWRNGKLQCLEVTVCLRKTRPPRPDGDDDSFDFPDPSQCSESDDPSV